MISSAVLPAAIDETTISRWPHEGRIFVKSPHQRSYNGENEEKYRLLVETVHGL